MKLLQSCCARHSRVRRRGRHGRGNQEPTDLPQSYLIGPSGRLTHAARRHDVRSKPVADRSARHALRRKLVGCAMEVGRPVLRGGKPPNFGWVHLAHAHGATDVPRGMVTIMTAYARTPSVASTVNVSPHPRPRREVRRTGADQLAGFTGVQFDGQITGPKNVDHIGHFFIPFSPVSHAAKYYPDDIPSTATSSA